MRKILYSNGYGAGWTSWTRDIKVAKLMLEYPPIIAAIEKGEKLVLEDGLNPKYHPAIEQLSNEIKEKFGENAIPYFGGANKLGIMEVSDDCKVRITDHDGKEDVETSNEWM